MFDLSEIPRRPGELLVVSDKLAAPSEFLLHALLASHLKDSKSSKCILVSFGEGLAHWKSVAARLSPPLNLASLVTSGSLTFIEGSQKFKDAPSSHNEDAPLPALYDDIRALLVNGDYSKGLMVIIDGLSAAEWLGLSVVIINRFVRAVRSLCNEHRAVLVVRHHLTTSDGIDNLLRSLLQTCACHIEVLPLASGRSGAVSGEIAVHRGPCSSEAGTIKTIPRSKATQYRLPDTGAIFFERGTGAGVL